MLDEMSLDVPTDRLAGFLEELAPLLPRGWRASLQLYDPVIHTLEEVASLPSDQEGKTALLSLVPLEELDRAPDPWLVKTLELDEVRIVPLIKERPFGRVLLAASAGARRLGAAREESIEELCRERIATLDRVRIELEEERFAKRLRWLMEGRMAERLVEACCELLPDVLAAAVMILSGEELRILRVRRKHLGLVDAYRHRTMPFRGSHLATLTGSAPDAPKASLPVADLQRYREGRAFLGLLEELAPGRVETIPLEPGGHLAGSLMLLYRRDDGSPEERRIVDRLAGALSIALDRTRPDRRHASRLLYLQELLHESAGGLETILETVIEEMVQYLGADAGALVFVDADSGRLLLSEHTGYDEANLPQAIPLAEEEQSEHSISARVVQTGEPYVAEDTWKSPVYVAVDRSIRSEIGVPLRLRGEVFGVALASSRSPRFFLPQDVGRFQLFADQVAVAVDNARLLENLQRRRTERLQARQRAIHGAGRAEDLEYHFGSIVGAADGPMGEVYRAIERVAPRENDTVLVTGETGTGKEVVAQAIHRASPRSSQPLVATNFAALGGDPNLIQSELFGHEKGAFTGAVRRRRGAFEKAHRSTLLIDELGDVVPSAQVKLLRVLGRSSIRELERLGGEDTVRVDVRIVAATNRDLLQEIEAGRFREDLYYRISALMIHIPPLRERPGDVPLLARHFLARLAGEENPEPRLSRQAREALQAYDWPGNVRQLESVLLRALVMFGDPRQVSASDVRQALAVEQREAEAPAGRVEPLTCPDPPPEGWFWDQVWEPFKNHRVSADRVRRLIEATLEQTGGFYTRTAQRLGVASNDYQKFLDFLTHHDLKVDWRPYRQS